MKEKNNDQTKPAVEDHAAADAPAFEEETWVAAAKDEMEDYIESQGIYIRQ